MDAVKDVNIIMKWDQSLSVGIDEIDEQHKAIIDMLNKLNRYADKSTDLRPVKGMLLDFKAYVEKHFECEENYMFYIDYPEYLDHREIHDSLLNSIDKLLVDLTEGKATKDDVFSFVKSWLLKHIKIEDTEIGKCASLKPEVTRDATKKILKPL